MLVGIGSIIDIGTTVTDSSTIDAAAAANASAIQASGVSTSSSTDDTIADTSTSSDKCNELSLWDLLVGDTGVCDATANNGIRQIPAVCNDVAFTGWLSVCNPYSNAELTAMTTSQLAKVAAVNPSAAAAGQKAIEKQAADAAANSTETCAYNAAVNYPKLSQLLSPAIVCALGGGKDQDSTSYTPYLIVGGIAVVGTLLVIMAVKQ